jgi:transcription-repair coupling factor (superfamily II helicase)
MLEFIDKKYDCLVSTMIIESGLDMPNVNTLIVHRADRLGLAQLYQIRGRVGRSDARAYAYLLTPPFQNLTQEAVKRLRTIEEFTELGSGIQIALRDLEIRGAGNLLGVEQSGYMDAVGFELYTRLVEEAVDEVKAEEAGLSPVTHPRVICQVDVHFPAFLPDTYVYDEGIRVNLYRRISQIQEMEELDSMEAELRDRFGALPEEAKRLLDVKCLQILAQSRGIKRISLGHPALTLLFDDQWIQNFPTPELFSRHLRSISDSVPAPIKFIQKKDFGLRVDISDHDTVGFAKKVLQSWS